MIERRTGVTQLWAGLYGSVARGNDEAGSELDLALVTASESASHRIRAALSEPASPRFVATISPIVLSRHALLRLQPIEILWGRAPGRWASHGWNRRP